MTKNPKKKILLAMLPYWDPMIPPNGIAHLKAFLQKHGYAVKGVDVIVEEVFQDIYNQYFKILEQCVPEDHRGNFFNMGHDVMEDHFMAHFNRKDEASYLELVKLIVYYTFYVRIDDFHAKELNQLLDRFFANLEDFFLRLMEKERPDVVGMTVYKQTLPASLFALKIIKENYPHVKTVVGGGTFVDTHTRGTPNFEILLEYSKDFLDKIILGQGELLFLKYLEGQLPESQRVYSKEDINGEILPFDQKSDPDFSDFDLAKYPYLPGTGSASCPFDCSFCVTRDYYGKHRLRDVKETAREMIDLHRQYGHQLFFMTDSLINPVVSKLAKELIAADASLYYDTYYKVDKASTDIEKTMLWRRGGLYRVRMGNESGSQKMLDMMGKKITPELTKQAVASLALAGIKTTTYWVIGHPEETEEDFQMTLDLVEDMKDDIYQAETNPFLYYYSAQNMSDQWGQKRKYLFPDWARDTLVFRTWTLEIEPLREEVFERMFRFEKHCRKLGIPNPYTLSEHMAADKRWIKLHKNAVPPLMDFLSRKHYIQENKNLQTVIHAQNQRSMDSDFDL